MKKRENQSNSVVVGDAEPAIKAKTTKNSGKSNRLKAKLLATYYGHPMKDMKMIAVTGGSGVTEVAHLVHEILKTAGQPVAIFAADGKFKIGALYKFLSEAWKAGANYVVVTAPVEAIENGVFADLPIHVAALTTTGKMPEEENNIIRDQLLKVAPDYLVLNRDDRDFEQFAELAGKDGTLLFGNDRTSHIQIVTSKLYKKGSEALLDIGGTRFTVASFLTGEKAVAQMACAAAVADALHISPEKITDGLANYEAAE